MLKIVSQTIQPKPSQAIYSKPEQTKTPPTWGNLPEPPQLQPNPEGQETYMDMDPTATTEEMLTKLVGMRTNLKDMTQNLQRTKNQEAVQSANAMTENLYQLINTMQDTLSSEKFQVPQMY